LELLLLACSRRLFTVAIVGRTDICEVLIDYGGQVDATDDCDYTALTYAAEAGKVGVCKLLLDRGATIDWRNDWDRTPLVFAAHNRRNEVCAMLIERGADIDARSSNNWSAIVAAAYKGYLDTCQLLVEYGADLWDVDTYEISYHSCVHGTVRENVGIEDVPEAIEMNCCLIVRDREGVCREETAQYLLEQKTSPRKYPKYNATTQRNATWQGFGVWSVLMLRCAG
jgi:ankyrin repeat protein